MKNKLTFIILILLAFTFNQCSDIERSAKELNAAKNIIEKDYPAALNNQDAAAYADLFADNVLWAAPNAPVIENRHEIYEVMQSRIEKNRLELSIEIREVSLIEDFAYVIADAYLTLHPKSGEPPVELDLTSIWLLKKIEGEWKITRQLYNNKGN